MTRDARSPSLESLHTLFLFAEHGEVTAVAKALGLDEAVISRRLKVLREEYALLTKQRRSLTLTDKGRAALPAIRSLLQQQAHLVDWLLERKEEPQVLSIATGSFGARFYLPRALVLFAEQHSDCQVRVQVRRGRERILGVADGTYDLSIVSHDAAQIRAILAGACGDQAALRIEPLAEHPLCLVAGKDTPFGLELSQILEGQNVPLSRLSAFPLVGLDPQSGMRRQLEAYFRGKSPNLCFRFEAGGWEAGKEYARHGLGVVVLPLPLLAREDRKDFIIRRLTPEIRIQVLLIDREPVLRPEHEALRHAVLQVALEGGERANPNRLEVHPLGRPATQLDST